MRAARIHGYKDIRIETLPEPECRPGAVKVVLFSEPGFGTDESLVDPTGFHWHLRIRPTFLGSTTILMGL